MFGFNKNKQKIDAGAEVERKKQENIEGERGVFSLGLKTKQLPMGAKSMIIFIIICSVVICGVFIWRFWIMGNTISDNSKNGKNDLLSNVLPPFELKKLPVVSKLLPVSSTYTETNKVEQSQIPPSETLQQRRLAGELKDETSQNTINQSPQGSIEQENSNNNELQNKLQPLHLNPSVAGILGDPDYLLTQGAMIDCQLETRMITTQPGMTSCYTTRNIYSTNGKVILIDRGSKIVGSYQSGMEQGQARIFVLWSRIETPKGVIINLDSSGTGPLGESGVGGIIDTHFWQRFGGAIMISLIGDFGEYFSKKSRSSKNSDTNINFNNTTQGMQQAAVEALKNSINIPPTLYKNQGDRIAIFVARDLNFKKVYELKQQ